MTIYEHFIKYAVLVPEVSGETGSQSQLGNSEILYSFDLTS